MNLRLDAKIARTAATAAAAIFLIAGAAFGADAIMNTASPKDDSVLQAPEGLTEPSDGLESELEDEDETSEPSDDPSVDPDDDDADETAEPSDDPGDD